MKSLYARNIWGVVLDIKTRKVIRALEKLAKSNPSIFLFGRGSKEGHKITPIIGDGRSYPLPTKHTEMNVYLVEAAGKKLEQLGVCTKDEFLKMVK